VLMPRLQRWKGRRAGAMQRRCVDGWRTRSAHTARGDRGPAAAARRLLFTPVARTYRLQHTQQTAAQHMRTHVSYAQTTRRRSCSACEERSRPRAASGAEKTVLSVRAAAAHTRAAAPRALHSRCCMCTAIHCSCLGGVLITAASAQARAPRELGRAKKQRFLRSVRATNCKFKNVRLSRD
jgi:hypothetical protein